MARDGVFGQNLFGTNQRVRDPTKYPLWRYFASAIVIAVACIYALPNLYRPDFAVQVKSDNSDVVIGTRFVDQLGAYLRGGGIGVKNSELTPSGALVRLNSDEEQIRAKAALEQRLNPGGLDRQFLVALNLAATTPQWLTDVYAKPMTLGLDLAGGIHFVLQVDMASALETQIADEANKLTGLLRDRQFRYIPQEDYVDGLRVVVPFTSEGLRDEAITSLQDAYFEQDYVLEGEDIGGSPSIVLTMSESRLGEIEGVAIEQNLTGLRSRVNEMGVSEPLVQRMGSDRIVIDLPGVQDSSEAKEILSKFATLEFRLVAKPDDRPSQVEVMDYEGRSVRLQRDNIITGENVINALQGRDAETGLPMVTVFLDGTGGERMSDATTPNVGHQMAVIFIELKPITGSADADGEPVIVEDRRLISVATIRSPLAYKFQVTGLTFDEARVLALLLRAGALAAPMYFVEERTVGASLGAENIERGFMAVTLGFCLVLVFMVVYYRVFGLIANIALTLNLVILVAVMSILEATLTLPGIAGIVLTVGMAVDANVLIFSRIREELKQSPPVVAIQAGYDRAFLTILDANLTTLFVALVLFAVGSGPVAGFAVTLSIGIVSSMFTAVFVSRGLVHLIYGRASVKKVWI